MVKERSTGAAGAVFTVGHSTRSLDDFIDLLTYNGVTLLIDVRSIPRSKRNPQFNLDTLADALKATGIGYLHLKGLGGLRHPKKDSPNTGWLNPSFRGYADYMLTDHFTDAMALLLERADVEQVAVMCAEALPWRCHRSLIADWLTVHGVPVEHIIAGSTRRPHLVTAFARIEGSRIIYLKNDVENR